MAKESKKTPQNRTLARITRTESYANKVRAMFDATVNRILELNRSLPVIEDGEMYSFDAQTEKMRTDVERCLRQLHSVATAAIENGIQLEWNTANAECDKLLQTQFGKSVLKKPEFSAWTQRNGAAMRSFIERSNNGMNLSDRVWQTTRQLRDEMEVAITVAVGDGTSAASLSRNVRKYLNDPDLMFRRFRYKDPETGEWRRKWKKRVIDPATGKTSFIDYDKDSYQDAFTGRGYYKSAAQNAMRVARTETNIAYRRADNERWNQMDFVLGQRVQMSRSHPKKDICDKLAGDYPKDFVFDGWHPQCFCFVTPINLDADTMAEIMSHDNWREEMQRVCNSRRVTDYPDNFKSWVNDNADNITDARARGTEPYFIRNNASIIDNILNPDSTPQTASTSLPENATDLIEHMNKFGDLDSHYDGTMNENEISRKWDSLTDEQRIEVIERGRFTGMIASDDSLDFANLYRETSRTEMVGALQDELTNLRDGYDVEDTNHYILKFKGDDTVIYSTDLTKPLTAAQLKKLEFVSANNGLSNYRYWVADDAAKQRLMREMGFVEYCEGKIAASYNGRDLLGNVIDESSASIQTIKQIADARHAARTSEQIADIQKRWEQRLIRNLSNEAIEIDVYDEFYSRHISQMQNAIRINDTDGFKTQYENAVRSMKNLRNKIVGAITPYTPHAAMKTEYKTLDDVRDSLKTIGDENSWFPTGRMKTLESASMSANGSSNRTFGRIRLTSERSQLVQSAMQKIGNGESWKMTKAEADAMSTLWHEMNHQMHIGDESAGDKFSKSRSYMELANEFVSRRTLPGLYKSMGCKTTPYPGFIEKRTSTGYDDMVRRYQYVIDAGKLKLDDVLSCVRNGLFNSPYDKQKTVLVDGLIAGGVKGKRTDIAKLVEMCESEQTEETILKYMKEKGLI